ncbi:MAG: alpha/beta hydrolase [bacterium]|nr:alpha/beta hydrolase [bacterium]MXX64494.1 alpha/beta hydrolase [Acidimicrobiia bacterium]MCY3579096.1 alpha/beta hydrolase [bacterium]MCY3653204.1 alpha/beta hydrolase [bacterium]MDE0642771.1 alpha/beta hydrolase [bacterium]
MDLMKGVSAQTVTTDRLRTHFYSAGPEDGTPIVMIHGNLSSGRFFEHLLAEAPDGYRLIAPDMRSFGRSAPKPIDATRGLEDWADDTKALLDALSIDQAPHLVGWSTGGAAIASYAMKHPVASLCLIDPVSPYGFGGTHPDGTPCYPDWAGTGGGTGNPELVQRINDGDRSTESPVSPRNVMTSAYWSAGYQMPPEREEILLDELLLSVTGDDGYPGDSTPSDNWPGMAPGTRGIVNALSGKYCNWSGLVDLAVKPPVLWTQGGGDIVVADGSFWEMGTLGQMELVPGWPGEDVFPPQAMVTQIREVLESYEATGGRVTVEMFEDSGHGPHLDAAERWLEIFFGFLSSIR